MRVIWKFPLLVTDHQSIPMPEGAEILCVQTQSLGRSLATQDEAQVFLWALVDPTAEKKPRHIFIHGTGMDIEEAEAVASMVKGLPVSGGATTYIGTFQLLGGNFVGHVFEGEVL